MFGKAQKCVDTFGTHRLSYLTATRQDMLKRIILGVAILAALAAGVVNFTVVKDKISVLKDDRDSQRSQKEQAQHELAQTKKTLAETQNTLAQTQQQLADAKTARDDALHKLTAANTKIQDLTDKRAKTTQDRDTAQAQLAAYTATGKTPQQVLALDKVLRDEQNALDVANQENAILSHKVASLKSQLAEILQPGYEVPLPANLKGTVMAVDPKWNFVVLNIGEEQGVIKDGEMLVSRNGKLVGKVVIRSVQKDRSIANLVPGWQLGEVFEGDQVIPAHPAS